MLTLLPAAYAVEQAPSPACYPTSVTRSEDGSEIRKIYDLSQEKNPAGIARSDFEHEERFHTETVSIPSKSKDMESVLALLPTQKEFVTKDGLTGILNLQLDTVQMEVAGYGSSTKEVSATRSYPNLASQDTADIPKSIEDGGRTLTLQDIRWQTDITASLDGYAVGDRYTAVATYTGNATSSYVKQERYRVYHYRDSGVSAVLGADSDQKAITVNDDLTYYVGLVFTGPIILTASGPSGASVTVTGNGFIQTKVIQ